MALFLVGAFISILLSGQASYIDLGIGFVSQVCVGVILGSIYGMLLNYVLVKEFFDDESLNLVLVASSSVLAWFLCEAVGANHLIFAYFYGMMLGRDLAEHDQYIKPYLTGISWISQASLFLLLGLQVFPVDVLDKIPDAIITTAVLLFVSRPLAVLCSFKKTYTSPKKLVFLSWAD